MLLTKTKARREEMLRAKALKDVTTRIWKQNHNFQIRTIHKINLPVTNNMFDNVSTALYTIQITIVGFIALSGFKTGRNYKRKE